MDKKKIWDITNAFEDIIYNNTVNHTKEDIQQIRELVNNVLDDFVKNNTNEVYAESNSR